MSPMNEQGILAIDATSGDWRQVLAYAERRVALLTAECVAVGTTAERRLICAAAIEELNTLMAAPQRTQNLTRHRQALDPADDSTSRSTY